jgi:hypothetical protein
MLYPKNNENDLLTNLFKNPPSEYRGTPFWAWNSKLDQGELYRQIAMIKQMGMGGFHIHCRTGLDIEYMGEEFLGLVKAVHRKAVDDNLLCWLYDEDRWPSGYGGGMVTKEEKFRSRFLVFTMDKKDKVEKTDESYSSTGKALRSNNSRLLAKYEVILDESGYLESYKRLTDSEQTTEKGKIWLAYLEVSGTNPWFNNQAYVNTLDQEAVKRFIEVTHEVYYNTLGDQFGKSVPAIFTDEPQFTHKDNFRFAHDEEDIMIPFTDDLEESYQQAYGTSLLDHLPEVFWDLPDNKISIIRYYYHNHVSERFSASFADTIGNWCSEHGIMLTGHMMEEPTLLSQTKALGEAMRSYRAFHLPGIDMLCDRREFTTAKQAQSAAHQFGAPGVLSEIYGVTNWDFDFRGHKLSGDWQAALGVTVRVHHLTWYSMAGEAKRDYPASIGYQSPWYKEYSWIEDHFSRVNTAMTRGKAQVKVGVIHPIESYWLYFGTQEHTAAIREDMERNFENITQWLLFGLIDFDFIAESLLPLQSDIASIDRHFNVGEMKYDVVLIPGCKTLRRSTVERLEAFKEAGGEVIFIGEVPEYVDAITSDSIATFIKKCKIIPFSRTNLLNALEHYRVVEVKSREGIRSDNLFYQMREDGVNRWLFICHVNKMKNADISTKEQVDIILKGQWNVDVYDTLNGNIYPALVEEEDCNTVIKKEFYEHDSILLKLMPKKTVSKEVKAQNLKTSKEIKLKNEMSYRLSEPNVLLLDQARFAFDNEPWQEAEDLLRIDNIFRKKLGYPLRQEALAQPWVNKEATIYEHELKLEFEISSEIPVEGAQLGLENFEITAIELNGVNIEMKALGWYTDLCIATIALPIIPKGKSQLVLKVLFNKKTNIENVFILGNFGVCVRGMKTKIIPLEETITFGNLVHQGLPFYGGNVTYICDIESNGGELEIEAAQFRNPLISVAVDGNTKGRIAFAPYKLNFPIEKGPHAIEMTVFGNRVNTFGTVHNCDDSTEWYGPDAWRTVGNKWSYEYRLKENGILVKPRLKIWEDE